MKTIKLTNGEINTIVKLLSDNQSIINSNDPNRRFSISILWNIETNFKKLLEINSRFEENREKIRSEYFTEERAESILDKNGNPTERVKIKAEFEQDFLKEMYELVNISNEVEIATIPFESLEKYELNGSELQSIRFMINDSVEKIEEVSGEVE